jgi:hypothetical protein
MSSAEALGLESGRYIQHPRITAASDRAQAELCVLLEASAPQLPLSSASLAPSLAPSLSAPEKSRPAAAASSLPLLPAATASSSPLLPSLSAQRKRLRGICFECCHEPCGVRIKLVHKLDVLLRAHNVAKHRATRWGLWSSLLETCMRACIQPIS